MESEFWSYVPRGVSIHSARVPLREVTPEALRAMARSAVEAARLLATADIDILVFGCTTGSLLEGVEWEKRLSRELEAASGAPVITTARAVVEALRTLDVRKLVVATPYIDELNEREKRFLEDNGFEVLRIEGMGIVDNLEIGRLSPGKVYRFAKKLFAPEADALFLSCTNMPTFFLVLFIIAVFGSNILYEMIVIGLTTWPATARIMRAQVLSVKEAPFVEASRAAGAGSWRILFRHVVPNAIYPAIANTILLIGNAIMIEAALSYLGLGDPNMPSWGRIIYEGQPYVVSAWWISFFPGLFLVITVLSINFIGDALMRIYTPRLRT